MSSAETVCHLASYDGLLRRYEYMINTSRNMTTLEDSTRLWDIVCETTGNSKDFIINGHQSVRKITK